MPPLLDAEPTPAKQSKIEQPSHEKKSKNPMMVLTLLFWSSDEKSQTLCATKGGGTRSLPEPVTALKAANPQGATRGGGGARCNLPTLGINLAEYTKDDKHFIPFEHVDAKRNPELIRETAETAARMAKQSMLAPNHVISLTLNMPLDFIGKNVSVSAKKWGPYKGKVIPFALLRKKDEDVFSNEFVTESAGEWFAGNIDEPELDELGVFNNEPGKTANDHENRFPFKVIATYGRVKKDGIVATREYEEVRADLPTVAQYGYDCEGPGVEQGHFDIYVLYINMPPADDFLLAEECTMCGQTTTELADMFAVAPCRHVNVCAGCYQDMLAKKTVHAFKCAICRCERPKGAAGAAGFAK